MTGNMEQLFGPVFRGPRTTILEGGAAAWAGRTTINSSDASVTVSTAMVASGQLFNLGVEPGSLGVGANSGGMVVVSSIVDNVSFALAYATAVGVPWDTDISWEIVRTADGQ